ncbi:GIN domain-containing protein [Aquimarina sp. 2304DJ70-9]|uniref:GIN domain-containing protein n=1 Tax=Aquimarina penaris TaxID=3231044 RepID=UPI0034634CD5
MRTLLLVLLSFLLLGNVYGQREKVKGNKIVSTEEHTLESFHTIEIYENFDVTLDESSDNMLKIEADSNLQELINFEIVDGILTIKSNKDLRRAKALNIEIFYASELKKIVLHNKVNVKSLSPITSSQITVEVNDNAEVFLTTDTNKINCVSNGKAHVELHSTATEVIYQINENSEIKGIVTADSLKVDLYQKASSELQGEVQSMLLRADNETDFYGEKLSSKKMSLVGEGSSDCYILVNEEITIEARDKTEIFLLGEPKININTFSNEATLFKKKIDYVPSKLRLN